MAERDQAALVRAYRAARRRLFLLDYDGTLIPFPADIEAAAPGAGLRRRLEALAADPANAVTIVSGRDRRALETWLGDLPLGLVGEHGAWRRDPGGAWTPAPEARGDWIAAVHPVLAAAAAALPRSVLEVKERSLSWHFRNADPEAAAARVAETVRALRTRLGTRGPEVVEGTGVVEIRNRDVHKGAAASRWVARESWDFLLAAGDDRTDEDLFAALPSAAWTVKVGAGATGARCRLPDPAALRRLLDRLPARAGAEG